MIEAIVYGIPNCDTTKKAITWLTMHKIPFIFHDYKKNGISEEKLAYWCTKKGWELIFNKRSSTWRGLPVSEQKKIIDRSVAIKIMKQHNSIIRRPIIEKADDLLVGFDEKVYNKHLK